MGAGVGRTATPGTASPGGHVKYGQRMRRKREGALLNGHFGSLRCDTIRVIDVVVGVGRLAGQKRRIEDAMNRLFPDRNRASDAFQRMPV